MNLQTSCKTNFIQMDEDGSGILIIGINGGDMSPEPVTTGPIQVPFPAKIKSWTLTADHPGVVLFDLAKRTFGDLPTVSSITGTDTPRLLEARSAASSELTDWDVAIKQDEFLEVALTAASKVRRVDLQLAIERV